MASALPNEELNEEPSDMASAIECAEKTNWVVVGTGALSSLWATGLQRAGANVQIYSRHQEDTPQVSITLQPDGQRTTLPVIHNAADAPAGAIWLVMVKAWQLEPLLAKMLLELGLVHAGVHENAHDDAHKNSHGNSVPKRAPITLILSHNGMGAAESLLRNTPEITVYDLVTTHGAWRQSRLETVHAGLGESWLGKRQFAQPMESDRVVNRYAQFAEPSQESNLPPWFDVLEEALPPLHWEANIEQRRWHKLAINCAINPLATAAGDVNGVLRKHEFQPKIRAVCEEIANLNPQLDADTLVAAVQQVVRATANNRCSMLQDSEAGKPTEIDYLNGFICREGARLQVTTRVNCELWQQLASLNTSKDNNEKE